MSDEKKILGEERRSLLIKWLKASDTPLTGAELAKRTNVSRQVIVQDVSLLKAKNHPILATAQGYIYMKEANTVQAQR
ncbi:HTH domain-containing protein, partial [Streptococcus suis]